LKHEVLRLESITKYIHGEKVLDKARLNLFFGEILGLIGLNHSGKTVLAKIISGFFSPDMGSYYINEQKANVNLGNASKKYGIFYIGRNSMLIPNMSIKENIFVFRTLEASNLLVNEKEMNQQTEALLERMELDLDPDIKVDNLSIEKNHLVQICRAIMSNASVIILDGITGTYGQDAQHRLVRFLSLISEQGISVIYVNNRLDEVYKIADRVTLLKEGKTIRTLFRDEYSENKVVNILAGYDLPKALSKPKIKFGSEVLRVDNLSCGGTFSDVSFSLNSGEILGLAVYEESIRNALGKALFGMCKDAYGSVYSYGKEISIDNPKNIISEGIGIIPEQACHKCFFNNFSVKENITFLTPQKMNNVYGLVKPKIDEYVAGLSLERMGFHEHQIEKGSFLSDIEKIKMIIERWMVLKPSVLIFIYPTLGIDMLARDEIYSMIYDILRKGTSILLITSDLRELINLSDRIILFKKGRIKDEIIRSKEAGNDSIDEKILNAFITE
jgi:ABC-type sugar transport system ATPase subunit